MTTNDRSYADGVNRLPPGIVLYGGTGQAKVVRPIVEHWGSIVVAVVDDTPGLVPPFPDVPLLEGLDALDAWLDARGTLHLGFLVTIGNPHGRARLRIHDALVARGLVPATVAHPTAWIDADVEVGEGSQFMAHAFVGTGSRLGRQCIVNTKASVDHECTLGDGVEIAPGATLCGLVEGGDNAWVCAGATVLPRVRLGPDSTVGAGAVALHDVPAGATVVGVPADRALPPHPHPKVPE